VYALLMRKLIVLTMFAVVLALGGTVANAHERHQHNAAAAVSADTQADVGATQLEAKETIVTAVEHAQSGVCAICGGTCCACGAGCVSAAISASTVISFPPLVRASIAPGIAVSDQPSLASDISGPPKTFA